MNEKLVVVFTSNNARIFHNPENLEELSLMPNAFVNPDLSKVNGFAPHFWKVKDGAIVPMDHDEIAARAKYLQESVADNEVRPIPLKRIKPSKFILKSSHVKDMVSLIIMLSLWAFTLWMYFKK